MRVRYISLIQDLLAASEKTIGIIGNSYYISVVNGKNTQFFNEIMKPIFIELIMKNSRFSIKNTSFLCFKGAKKIPF
jgi:hypothetical protein